MYREIFPSRIKQARKKSGFTQREVAIETGIPPSTIAKYETGKLEPDLEKLGMLADFYSVSTDWLLGMDKATGDAIRAEYFSRPPVPLKYWGEDD